MWLYLPQPSTVSVSAPGGAVSTLGLSLQSQRLAASLWWRGKPSPSRTWSQRLNRVSWLQQLSGRMCEPSTAGHGAASWISSLAASRASRTAWPGRNAAALTSATSGARRDGSSSSRGLGSASSKMSGACSRPGLTKSLAPNGFSETYANLVSRLNADCSRRLKWAQATSARGSSSSSWPTPTVMLSGEGTDPEVFRARAEKLKEQHRGRTGNGAGPDLAMAVKMWPTPNATDGDKGTPGQEFAGGLPSLTRAATALWPTPEARDGKGAPQTKLQDRGGKGAPLNEIAVLWMTPRASDAEHGGPEQRDSSGNAALPSQASNWSSPTTADSQGSSGGRVRKSSLRNEARKSLASILPDRPISTDGDGSSHIRRTLNPLFVEWLMGWPRGWTCLALTPPASTGSACSAMALSAWKRRMQSALLSLGSPRPAMPAQLSLLG